MREDERIFSTIKELYDWAVENGYENYKVFVNDSDGYGDNDIFLCEIFIDKKKKEISL